MEEKGKGKNKEEFGEMWNGGLMEMEFNLGTLKFYIEAFNHKE